MKRIGGAGAGFSRRRARDYSTFRGIKWREISLFLIVAIVAMDNVALVFLAENDLRSGAGGYGLLSSIYGVGMGLAPLLLLRWKRRRVTTLLLLLGIFLDGLGTLLTGLAPVLLLAALAQLLAGCGNGFENVSNNALIQETVPRKRIDTHGFRHYTDFSRVIGYSYIFFAKGR